jgi:hypothetical protein
MSKLTFLIAVDEREASSEYLLDSLPKTQPSFYQPRLISRDSTHPSLKWKGYSKGILLDTV